jgi:hypothetical protein
MTIKLEEITTVSKERLPLVWSALTTGILLQSYTDFNAVEGDVVNLSEEEKEVYWGLYVIENSLPYLKISDDLKRKVGNLARRHASVMSDAFSIGTQILSTQARTKQEFDLHIQYLDHRFSSMPNWMVFRELEECLLQGDMDEFADDLKDEE